MSKPQCKLISDVVYFWNKLMEKNVHQSDVFQFSEIKLVCSTVQVTEHRLRRRLSKTCTSVNDARQYESLIK